LFQVADQNKNYVI